MSIAAAAAVGMLIGTVLGALGGGGAILTVPALVYLLGQNAQDATTSSLVIVGATAVTGALSHARVHNVRWRTGVVFGGAGIAAAFAGTALNHRVAEHVLLLGFAAVTAVAAIGMLIRAHHGTGPAAAETSASPGPEAPHHRIQTECSAATTLTAQLPGVAPAIAGASAGRAIRALKIVAAGLAIGFLTGFFGVGGGFVIVPALVLGLGLPMPAAVGTSLLIIAINSAAALGARAGTAQFDWTVIVPFALAAMAAALAGRKIADRLPSATLSRAFALLLLVVAAYIAVTSTLAIT